MPSGLVDVFLVKVKVAIMHENESLWKKISLEISSLIDKILDFYWKKVSTGTGRMRTFIKLEFETLSSHAVGFKIATDFGYNHMRTYAW